MRPGVLAPAGDLRSLRTALAAGAAEGVRFAEQLGCTRVVVPRELSVEQIRTLRGQTEVELEVFVHGALCMSWSGQCLSSEAWGGRSANRGQCAQACRMPYDLMVDGEHQPLGDVERPDVPAGDGPELDPVPALGGEHGIATGPRVARVKPRPGSGVVFDAGNPEDRGEPGCRVFAVEKAGGGWILRFGRPGPDLSRVREGHRVWVTGDPADARAAEKLLAGPVDGRVALDLVVSGAAGQPLRVEAMAAGQAASVDGDVLTPARSGGLDEALLASKLGTLGGTPFTLGVLDTSDLEPGLHVPVSRLKALRRRLVEALVPLVERGRHRTIRTDAVATVRRHRVTGKPAAPPQLVPLVRTPEQLDAVIAAGLPEVELDWMEMVGLGKAVAKARAAGLGVTIATVRVQKPGEEGYDARIAKLRPDAVLVRHWGALMGFAERAEDERPVLYGDFSLNISNSVTAHHVLGLGLDSFTVTHDLDTVQLRALLANVPTSRAIVTVHHHIPTSHNEHCVDAQHLSAGRDWRTCGRPCDNHRVSLRDHQGREHPVVVDVECRNTVFNAAAQSAASLVPELVAAGVQRLRVEFVWESADEVRRTLAAYQALLDGECDAAECVRRVGVHEQFGVTLGTMQVLGAL